MNSPQDCNKGRSRRYKDMSDAKAASAVSSAAIVFKKPAERIYNFDMQFSLAVSSEPIGLLPIGFLKRVCNFKIM